MHFGMASSILDAPVRRSLYIMVGGGLVSLVLAGGLACLTAWDIAQRRREAALRSAAELRVSEERGRVAIAAADLGTWRWDLERDMVFGSERCRALLNLPASPGDGAEAEWPSREVMASIDRADGQAFLEAIEDCLATDKPIAIEFRTARRDGMFRWVRLAGRVERFEDRQPRFINGVIADIDSRKQAEAERLHLRRRLGQAQEEERRRIARELHDQVGQTVVGLSLGLKGLEQMLDNRHVDGPIGERVRWLQALTTTIGREIHRAASDLRPTALDDLGLQKALATYGADWSARCGVAIDVQTVGRGERLPIEIETTVYRIAQEALTNVVKHAAARNVGVVLEHKPDELRLIVEDDGRGFALEPALSGRPGEPTCAADPRLGLTGIRERVSLVGGTMFIESALGVGTALFIQIPIARTAARADG